MGPIAKGLHGFAHSQRSKPCTQDLVLNAQ
jgi:hypothetical protein